MTTANPSHKWTWLRNPAGGWHAQLRGGFIDAQEPRVPSSIVVHRRDGTASQHDVVALLQPGSNPVVAVRQDGSQAEGYRMPDQPAVRWKHSNKRSRANFEGLRAAVFRSRKNGRKTWSYHILKPTGHPLHTGQDFANRKSALHACEDKLLPPPTQPPCPGR